MTIDTIFCSSCGTPNHADARFCYKCGAQILTVASTVAVAPPIAPPSNISPPPLNTSNFITLACPNCGGKLTITADLERFACQFCGSEHIVRRTGSTVSLEPVMKMMHTINDNITNMSSGLDLVKSISEKQAAEMAIKRLNKEIEDLQKQSANLETGSSTTWMIFGISAVVTFLSIIVLAMAGDEGIVKLIFIPGVVIGGLMTIIGLISVIAVSSSRKKREHQIHDLMTQKIQELNRNQQIVNS